MVTEPIWESNGNCRYIENVLGFSSFLGENGAVFEEQRLLVLKQDCRQSQLGVRQAGSHN